MSARDGAGSPRRARPSRTKASIGLAAAADAGGSGRSTGRKAQCSRYSAPSVIQRRSASICVAVRRDPSGGICTSGSTEVIRARISLAASSPGTIARRPLSSVARDGSARSSRSPASRVSGPWQAKHRLARSGWMSREKSTSSAAAGGAASMAMPTAVATSAGRPAQRKGCSRTMPIPSELTTTLTFPILSAAYKLSTHEIDSSFTWGSHGGRAAHLFSWITRTGSSRRS